MHIIEKLLKHELVWACQIKFLKNSSMWCVLTRQSDLFFFQNQVHRYHQKTPSTSNMDLFSLTRTINIEGKRYYFILIDNFWRFIWVTFLAHKDEALSNLKTSAKRCKEKKNIFLLPSIVIMKKNLRIKVLRTSTINMGTLKIYPLLDLLIKMVS